jgi:hypothetical protein
MRAGLAKKSGHPIPDCHARLRPDMGLTSVMTLVMTGRIWIFLNSLFAFVILYSTLEARYAAGGRFAMG